MWGKLIARKKIVQPNFVFMMIIGNIYFKILFQLDQTAHANHYFKSRPLTIPQCNVGMATKLISRIDLDAADQNTYRAK